MLYVFIIKEMIQMYSVSNDTKKNYENLHYEQLFSRQLNDKTLCEMNRFS